MSIRFLSKGKFIMSASTDTSIHVWDLKGEVLASINTNQMTNSYAAISPCGRSVRQPHGFATCDVGLWTQLSRLRKEGKKERKTSWKSLICVQVCCVVRLHPWRQGVGGLLRKGRRFQGSGSSFRSQGPLGWSSCICLFQRLSQVIRRVLIIYSAVHRNPLLLEIDISFALSWV